MLLYLQIAFIIIAAVFAAAALPVGTWLGFPWAIACVMLALLFFGLCLLCKQSRAKHEEPPQELQEPSKNDKEGE
ncbi:MAG: hypothetical protein IJ514_07115 [Clostridia bacterium]|nr:hypothetical protein [Clostridia bacterium]